MRIECLSDLGDRRLRLKEGILDVPSVFPHTGDELMEINRVRSLITCFLGKAAGLSVVVAILLNHRLGKVQEFMGSFQCLRCSGLRLHLRCAVEQRSCGGKEVGFDCFEFRLAVEPLGFAGVVARAAGISLFQRHCCRAEEAFRLGPGIRRRTHCVGSHRIVSCREGGRKEGACRAGCFGCRVEILHAGTDPFLDLVNGTSALIGILRFDIGVKSLRKACRCADIRIGFLRARARSIHIPEELCPVAFLPHCTGVCHGQAHRNHHRGKQMSARLHQSPIPHSQECVT